MGRERLRFGFDLILILPFSIAFYNVVVLGLFWCSQKWTTDEVIAWLEREGLGSLCSTSQEQGFNGGILLALYDVRMDSATFKLDCRELGIPGGAVQITLKGKLVALFG